MAFTRRSRSSTAVFRTLDSSVKSCKRKGEECCGIRGYLIQPNITSRDYFWLPGDKFTTFPESRDSQTKRQINSMIPHFGKVGAFLEHIRFFLNEADVIHPSLNGFHSLKERIELYDDAIGVARLFL